MAAERLTMRKTKEILRLHFGLGMSGRKISQSCNIARSTVADYIMKAKAAGIGWPLPDGLDDAALDAKLFASHQVKTSDKPTPQMEEIHKELRKKGVTLQLLWIEYKQSNPDGYQYSRYCELYGQWTETLDLSLRQEYRAGEKMFVDFAGKGIAITNPVQAMSL